MVPCGGRLVLWTWVFMFDLETGEQESRMVRWDAVVLTPIGSGRACRLHIVGRDGHALNARKDRQHDLIHKTRPGY